MNSQLSEQVMLPLTVDEATVLFEFLRRYSDTDVLEIRDQAEQRALWNLNCTFEKHLSQQFDVGYHEFLEAARSRLRDAC